MQQKHVYPTHFLKEFTYSFLEAGRGREKEKERNIDVRNTKWLPLICAPMGTEPAAQVCPLTGNRTGDVSLCGMMFSQLSHTSQDYPAHVTQLKLRKT